MTHSKESLKLDFDDILDTLKFGKFQIKIICLIGIVIIFGNIFPLSFTLTASDLKYRCRVRGCDDEIFNTSIYSPDWLPNAVPYKNGDPRKCEKFKTVRNINNKSECQAEMFDHKSSPEICQEWIFETVERTIVRDFDIRCEQNEWKLSMVGTVNNIGQFIGIPFFGVISDRFGRKTIVIWCSVASAIFGIARAFSANYLMFVIFEFLDAFFAGPTFATAFTLVLESVNPSKRALIATILETFYPIGAIIMGSVAWYVQDWRKMLLICYTPGLLFAAYQCILPESIRWLYMNKQDKKVIKLLRQIAKSNKVTLPKDLLESVTNESKNMKIQGNSVYASLKQVFQSRRLTLRLINCSYSWFAIAFIYYGLAVNSVTLSGNKYFNFILTSAVEIPSQIFFGLISCNFKRRTTLPICLILCGAACVIMNFVPTSNSILQILFFLTGKFLITLCFIIIYIYTAEMFPTELRLSMSGFASMIGRIGSGLAPQTILLHNVIGQQGTAFIFGAVAITAGYFATFFPETFNKKLPDTVSESDKVDN